MDVEITGIVVAKSGNKGLAAAMIERRTKRDDEATRAGALTRSRYSVLQIDVGEDLRVSFWEGTDREVDRTSLEVKVKMCRGLRRQV